MTDLQERSRGKTADLDAKYRERDGAYFFTGVQALVRVPVDQPHEYAVYHTFVIQAEARDDLRAYLAAQGIGTVIHYPAPIHVQRAAAGLGYQPGDFPVTMAQAQRILSLPVYPELTEAQRATVVAQVRSFYDRD